MAEPVSPAIRSGMLTHAATASALRMSCERVVFSVPVGFVGPPQSGHRHGSDFRESPNVTAALTVLRTAWPLRWAMTRVPQLGQYMPPLTLMLI